MSENLLAKDIQDQLAAYQSGLSTHSKLKTSMQQALEDLKILPIPGKKIENWKYTASTKMLDSLKANVPTTDVLKAEQLNSSLVDPKYKIVFSNGQLLSELTSLPKGVEIQTLKEIEGLPVWAAQELDAPKTDLYYSYLNLAGLQSLISLKVTKNKVIETPITIVHHISKHAEGSIILPRILIDIEASSEVHIVENHVQADGGSGKYLHCPHTFFNVQNNSQVSHIRIFQEGLNAEHVGHVQAEVSKDATFRSFLFTVGGHQSRHNVYVNLNEEGSHCDVHGLYTLRGEQHGDHYSRINHNKSHTTSEQLYKGILAGVSHGIFTGKVHIARDAQQVNASQLNKNLLLTKKAHIDTRPQLEVYADDVKAAHGATVGQISDDEKFYLETRGIPPQVATRMLGHGFAKDVINKVKSQKVRIFLEQVLYLGFEKFSLEDA